MGQWLKLPVWQVEDRGLAPPPPRSGIHVPRKHEFLPRSRVEILYYRDPP